MITPSSERPPPLENPLRGKRIHNCFLVHGGYSPLAQPTIFGRPITRRHISHPVAICAHSCLPLAARGRAKKRTSLHNLDPACSSILCRIYEASNSTSSSIESGGTLLFSSFFLSLFFFSGGGGG